MRANDGELVESLYSNYVGGGARWCRGSLIAGLGHLHAAAPPLSPNQAHESRTNEQRLPASSCKLSLPVRSASASASASRRLGRMGRPCERHGMANVEQPTNGGGRIEQKRELLADTSIGRYPGPQWLAPWLPRGSGRQGGLRAVMTPCGEKADEDVFSLRGGFSRRLPP
jgi:hypothetical protein